MAISATPSNILDDGDGEVGVALGGEHDTVVDGGGDNKRSFPTVRTVPSGQDAVISR
jgi:hypothetical protein